MDNKTIAFVETFISVKFLRREINKYSELGDTIWEMLDNDWITEEEANELEKDEYLLDIFRQTANDQWRWEDTYDEKTYQSWLQEYIEYKREVL